jgi:transglutaminase-like putative cysteine protease
VRAKFLLAGSLAYIVSSIPLHAEPANTVLYGKPGSWVLDVPAPGDSSGPSEAPVRMIQFDNQIHVLADGTQETYSLTRYRIQKPEGLAGANLSLTWLPDQGPATVHRVRLFRDGKVTDVLATAKFAVVQREQLLEQAVLTGTRTAVLQVPGVQVGDELEFAVSVRQKEPAFGGHVGGRLQMPYLGVPGVFRFRLVWPQGHKMDLRGSPDLPALTPVAIGTEQAVEVTMRDPRGALPTEGAPARYNVRRLIEYSDYPGWADVSAQMAPLYARAAALSATSPIRAEAAAIAARTADPVARAEAALRLVQDRIRYVYVGLGGGNFTPASADQTWERKFGDCKAKTVLLIALLRELGIEARPALVLAAGADGLDQRLPGPDLFDHVIVRAQLGDRVEWLDGTQVANSYLDNQSLPYRTALPVAAEGATLEPIARTDTGFPQFIGVVDIDASAGAEADAGISAHNVVRGDEAVAIRIRLTSLSAEDADRALKTYWRQQLDWAIADKVSWTFDERRRAVVLGMEGRGNPGWEGDAGAGHSMTILGAGFAPPDQLRRPADQDQAAPWELEFPRFRCWATTVRLPKAGARMAWSLFADPMAQKLGGVAFWRASGLSGNVVRTVMSRRSEQAELSPEMATALNRAIPRFNNKMSNIAEVAPRDVLKSSAVLPFGDTVDWVNAPTPCSAK